ncbi:small-subunit processome [Gilbertella persicaria]|uniref:small-subunit processome n=1 Tax=Gilbertella persicaria TaxID=101096 RepID=UPI00221F1A29|nr:small-subunit processome [Gilbertella persicaria]KAI8062362.1 small-subunit processome [Gilbertella persicaria]
MARQQKKSTPKKPSHNFKGKKHANEKASLAKSFNRDVFVAEEEDDRRKGHDFDEVENLEYDAGEIAEEDDSEIDSDEAFDESDEERFADYKFAESSKKKKPVKKTSTLDEGEIDMNEDSDEEDDGSDVDGEGFVDLSQMLENNDDEDEPIQQQLEEDDDSEDDEAFRGFDDIEDEEESEDDKDMEIDEDKVADLISSLDSKKRRRANDEEGNAKKRQLKEKSEAYKESEFNLTTREEDDNSKKLSLSDLMGTVEDESSLGVLKTGLETLAGKGKNLTRRALDAPLAKRVQDRLERQAALTSANEEISKWQPTVKMNREAEHLVFPMQDTSVAPKESRTSAAMASKFKAETPLEQQIAEALAQAGMKDEELEEFEALKLNKLTVEEVEARRKELRMMRELMFRHEVKNKRLKKIKSKSYRKLQRKEKEKMALQINEIDHEMDQEDKMEAAMSRAEERMTLKHKNTSKWAKRALARGTQDEGTREAIMEQLRRGEELRRRIGDDDESEQESDEAEDDEEYVNNQLSKLNEEFNQDTQPTKGLMSMKFMQDAAKRQLDATKQDLATFEKEWLAADSDDDDVEKKEEHYTVIANNPGRMAFGAKAKQVKKSSEKEEEEEETIKITVNEGGQIKKVSHSAAHNTRTTAPVETKNKSPLADLDNDVTNPWLQADTSRLAKKASKKNKVTTGQNESRVEHSLSKLNKAKKDIEATNDTDDVELDLTKVMTIKKKSTPAKASVASAKLAKGESESESEDESDDENESNVQMVHKDRVSFNQKELVARAFAHDDVVTEFEDEKRAEVEEDGDKVEDLTLPGWGSWGGAGVKKNKKKKILKVTKGIEADKRKDAKLSHVIINEKMNKKAEKYQTTSVPFPFKTMEQYERSISTPVGSEWNTRQTFLKLTKPRVITKLGKVIDPLKAPFA